MTDTQTQGAPGQDRATEATQTQLNEPQPVLNYGFLSDVIFVTDKARALIEKGGGQ